MKRFPFAVTLIMAALILQACQNSKKTADKSFNRQVASYDSIGWTNDFFDNEPTFELAGPQVIVIEGEVGAAVSIDLKSLPQRSLIIKETQLRDGEAVFTGAYRYDGASLFDILKGVKVQKKNTEEFNPVIDQYVVIYGASGDSVVFSWGEIYYPVQLHQILIAVNVSRIVPSKSKNQWPLPETTRIIAGNDLVTERNISEPDKIIIRSVGISYKVDRSVKLWAPEMVLTGFDNHPVVLSKLPPGLQMQNLDQVFYGRGMGIHGITQFRGAWLKDLLVDKLPVTSDRIKSGLFVIAAVDGYRCSMTYSELMNRNDQAGVILMDENNFEQAGKFSCVFGADFFSDRAIKAITEIRVVQ